MYLPKIANGVARQAAYVPINSNRIAPSQVLGCNSCGRNHSCLGACVFGNCVGVCVESCNSCQVITKGIIDTTIGLGCGGFGAAVTAACTPLLSAVLTPFAAVPLCIAMGIAAGAICGTVGAATLGQNSARYAGEICHTIDLCAS